MPVSGGRRGGRRGVSTALGAALFLVLLLGSLATIFLVNNRLMDYNRAVEEVSQQGLERKREEVSISATFDEYNSTSPDVRNGTLLVGDDVSLSKIDGDYAVIESEGAGGWSSRDHDPQDGDVLGETETIVGGWFSLVSNDTNYWQLRSYASEYNLTSDVYHPTNFTLLGGTTNTSGSLSDLTSNDGVNMTFRSYYTGTSGVFTARPNADGTYTDWTPLGGGDHYVEVDEVTQDGDASYVYTAADAMRDSYHLTDHTAEWGSISLVNVFVYARQTTGNEELRGCVVIGGTPYDHAEAIAPTRDVYTQYNWSWAQNPATGLPWTWSDIDSLEAGILSEAFGAWKGEMRVTQLYVEVTYTADQYTMEVEFTGPSNTQDWVQLNWTIDSAWTVGSVGVTLQLYNYALDAYPTSGDGYMAYTSDATPRTDELKSQIITTNPTDFRNATGYWKIKVTGVKDTSTQFDWHADLVEFTVSYGAPVEFTSDWYGEFRDVVESGIQNLTISYWGYYDTGGVNQTMYLYNYHRGRWEAINSTIYDTGGSGEWHNVTVTTYVYDYISNGRVQVRIEGVKSTSTQFDCFANYLHLVDTFYTYSVSDWNCSFSINQNASQLVRFEVTYVGHISVVNVTASQELYIYDFGQGKWSLLTSVIVSNYDTQIGPITLNSTLAANYINADKEIRVRVVSNASRAHHVFADYLHVKVYPTSGNGYITLEVKNVGGLSVHLVRLMVINSSKHIVLNNTEDPFDEYLSPGETMRYNFTFSYSWTVRDTWTFKVISERGNVYSYTTTPLG